jgi:phosphoribosyl 1,2-cyclic phosphodiesterase
VANAIGSVFITALGRYTVPMEVISLQSGSSGNCVFVRSGETSLIFDAGISGSKAEMRLAEYGYDIRDCNALIVSHEHSDHISSVGVFHRKFGLPVFANLRTWNATRAKPSTGCLGSPNYFVSGKSFQIGSLRIETLRTPHDAIDGVCFVIEDMESGQRFGLLTDLGHVFKGLQNVIGTLDAVLIESNYDDAMLLNGPYPQHLKDRISGKRGHISNKDAAELLDLCEASQLQWVCLGHLSAHNNSPEVALATHRERHGDRFSLFCADRDGAMQLPRIKQMEFTLKAIPASA